MLASASSVPSACGQSSCTPSTTRGCTPLCVFQGEGLVAKLAVNFTLFRSFLEDDHVTALWTWLFVLSKVGVNIFPLACLQLILAASRAGGHCLHCFEEAATDLLTLVRIRIRLSCSD